MIEAVLFTYFKLSCPFDLKKNYYFWTTIIIKNTLNMETVFSIIMAAMGFGLLFYAGIAYLSGDPIILFQDTYSFPKGKKEKKEYVRKKFVKIIALIALSFLASSLVGLTQIYWLAMIVFVLGIVLTVILGKKIMNS